MAGFPGVATVMWDRAPELHTHGVFVDWGAGVDEVDCGAYY